MAPIRVVLGPMPALLGDIIRETLAGREDLEIVARVTATADLVPAARRTGAMVGLVSVPASDTDSVRGLIRTLMAEHPRFLLIALASDARSGVVYRLQPSAVAIADLSPTSLVEAIKGVHPVGVHLPLHPFSAD